SSGTANPASRAAERTPTAVTSFAQVTAVGTRLPRSSIDPAVCPTCSVKSPGSTRAVSSRPWRAIAERNASALSRATAAPTPPTCAISRCPRPTRWSTRRPWPTSSSMRTVSKRPVKLFEQPMPTKGRPAVDSSTCSMSARSETIRKPSTPRRTRSSIASVSAATGYSGIRRRVGTTTAVRPVVASSMRMARTRSEIQVLRIVFTSTATTPRCSVSPLSSSSGKRSRSAVSRTRPASCGLISSEPRSARSATALEMPSEFATSLRVPRSWPSVDDSPAAAGSGDSSGEVASLLMPPLNRMCPSHPADRPGMCVTAPCRAGVFPRRPGGRARWAAGPRGAYCRDMNDSLAGHGDRPRPRLSPSAIASVAVGGLLLCSWFWVSLALLITGLGALPALGSGLLLLVPWLLLMQLVVRIERRRAVAVHGLRVILPARRRSRRGGTAGWLQDRWFELATGAFWRGVLHHHLAILVTGLFFLAFAALLWCGWKGAELALVHGPVELASRELSRTALAVLASVCVLLSAAMLALGALADRGLARGLISGSEDDLREQVAELTERRQGAVDAAAQERLRIERDLHDGVQPRLVTLAMTLGVARGAIRADPARAEQLVGEAHAEAKAVMTDLRQLARGIHPAVLTD